MMVRRWIQRPTTREIAMRRISIAVGIVAFVVVIVWLFASSI